MFQGRKARLTAPSADEAQEAAALALRLALMTAESLEMIGAQGPSVIEGPFGANAAYRAMLASATRRPVEAAQGGTALGAALLAAETARPSPPPTAQDRPDPILAAYAARWRAALHEP